MPIYQYQCPHCQHQFDALQKMSDAHLSTCPSCNKDGLKKCITAAGFQLKGKGWYETDFKNPPKTTDTKKSKSTVKEEV